MKVLLTAAHGNNGRILLPRFHAAGFAVRAMRATPGRDQELIDAGASEVAVGNAADRGFLREAVSGVDTVYHIGPTANPLEREMGFAMVDTAREAGIGHFVYSSVLHPIAEKMVQHKLKREVEEHLLEANIPFTVLQPADYMLPRVFAAAFETGKWEQLYDLKRGQAMVALEDVAEVAVKVIREREKHFGATYQLCAPGNHSAIDLADAVTRVTGRRVEPVLVTPDEYFERFYGVGQGEQFRYQLGMIRSVALWYGQYEFAGNPNVLTWLLGRPPIGLEDYIAREWGRR
jgi:uncharacterized protein YbjT (DUF2867 family)